MVNRQATIGPEWIFISSKIVERRKDSLLHSLLDVSVDLIEQDFYGGEFVTVFADEKHIIVPEIKHKILAFESAAVVDLPEAPCDRTELFGVFGLNDVGDIPALGRSDLAGLEIAHLHLSAVTLIGLAEDPLPDFLAQLVKLASAGTDGVSAHVDPSVEFFIGYGNDLLSILLAF